MSINYKVGMLLGRLSNGNQSDHGTRYHAVVTKRVKQRPCPQNQWGRIVVGDGKILREVSLCGSLPGPRSIGWNFNNFQSEYDKNMQVNCPRCLSKIEKVGK